MTVEQHPRPCPTPDKKYRTWNPALAMLLAESLTATRKARYDAYRCPCGDYHIRNTTKKNQHSNARKAARRAERRRAARPLETVIMIAEHAEWLP